MKGRNGIIRLLVESGEMPSASQLAAELNVTEEAVRQLLAKLHAVHALLLDADGSIRMLWPFSGVPTPFRVTAGGRTYWANCAWDALGIPAALHTDAEVCVNGTTTIEVKGGKVSPDHFFVHFPLPLSQWYRDLVYT